MSQLILELLKYTNSTGKPALACGIIEESQLIPNMAVLLKDSNALVRQAAIETMVQLHEAALIVSPSSSTASLVSVLVSKDKFCVYASNLYTNMNTAALVMIIVDSV